MAFIEFETEELFNAEIDKRIEEKNQSWITGRLQEARNKAIDETRAEYSDYADLKEQSGKWAEVEEGYKKQISEANEKIAGHDIAMAKLKAALKYGLDSDDADRLKGATEEEILKDAEKFSQKHSRKPSAPLRNAEGGQYDGVMEAFYKRNPNLRPKQ